MTFNEPVVLGRTGLKVGRLGVASGYGAPTAAVLEAFERDCNYWTWGTVVKGFSAHLREAIKGRLHDGDQMSDQPKACKMKILKNGPVLVTGSVPLSRDDMIIGADSEPERWEKSHFYPPASTNALCRCGGSARKPFCDGSHVRNGFDGTETAPDREDPALIERTEGPTLDLTWSAKICATARFCHRAGDAWTLTEQSNIPSCRETAIQEACDCPSGALTAYEKGSDQAIEADRDPAVSLVENPASGLSGPIRVLGSIPIESAAGTAYEVRNRVTLCRCGASNNKPFCDGTHTVIKFNSKS